MKKILIGWVGGCLRSSMHAFMATMAFAAEKPSIENQYTTGYAHQLRTVITYAVPIFFAISGCLPVFDLGVFFRGFALQLHH